MPITQATDTDLRTLIFQHPRVIVMFVTADCAVCDEMELLFQACSEKAGHKEITFLLMDAAENPVSSKEVSVSGTPFFATYKNGILFYCSLISNEAGLNALLAKFV